jgi:hypothetical protein
MNVNMLYPLKTSKFISNWILRLNELDTSTKKNLLQLYAIVNNKLVQVWDLPSQRLANVIHPKRIKDVYDISLDTDLTLNLHITFINYFGQINDSEGISESFDYIDEHFKKTISSAQDEIDLVLFYNYWSRYDLTLRLLFLKFYKNELEENALFILLKTAVFYPKLNSVDILKIHKKAFEINQSRWCNYVDYQFQILRDPNVKKIFCEKCSDLDKGH